MWPYYMCLHDIMTGKDIYTSSTKSPCKNALLTSIWSKYHPFTVAKERTIMTEIDLATREKVSG